MESLWKDVTRLGVIKINKISEISDCIYGNGIENEVINQAEKELNLEFSNSYREYLQEYGSAIIEGHELTGLGIVEHTNVIKVTKEHKKNCTSSREDIYVLEDANIDGIVIWQASNGEVFRSVNGSDFVNIANDLQEYIDTICE